MNGWYCDVLSLSCRFIFFHGFFDVKKPTPEVPETAQAFSVPIDQQTRATLSAAFYRSDFCSSPPHHTSFISMFNCLELFPCYVSLAMAMLVLFQISDLLMPVLWLMITNKKAILELNTILEIKVVIKNFFLFKC